MPGGIPSGKVVSRLYEKYAVQIANGQAELNDKIFRVSHMGDVDLGDFEQLAKLIRDEVNFLRD